MRRRRVPWAAMTSSPNLSVRVSCWREFGSCYPNLPAGRAFCSGPRSGSIRHPCLLRVGPMRRREFIAFLSGAALAWPSASRAQQATVPVSKLYDGEWNGSATATTGPCKPALVRLTVEGKVVTGQVRFERNVASISGTVLEDGSVGATIGFRHLTGN